MRISDWSSDVCSSDLDTVEDTLATIGEIEKLFGPDVARLVDGVTKLSKIEAMTESERAAENLRKFLLAMSEDLRVLLVRSEEHTSELQSLMRISYAVFCLKKKNLTQLHTPRSQTQSARANTKTHRII